MLKLLLLSLLGGSFHVQAETPKQNQLKDARVNTAGQIETTDTGVEDNTANSLRAGPRGYNLLEDTTVRKKIFHFDHERVPERVVHALGHGAYGTFESYGDWSNLTSACWLGAGEKSDVFTRFSVVVASNGGSESGRDTHGFATKIYSRCGNHDLVGNHVPSFFINDGADFPDLVHAVKYEADKGFPTGGSAHTTAYDFFTQHPEGTFQLMTVLSDLGIPRDVRHISGNGVHTFRFINDAGKSTLFKWYWKPMLGHRALVYDEATKIAGKNNNFQRIDLYNNIAAGIYPEWEFMVQLFPDDGTYMWNGIDLVDPTMVIPLEMNPPMTLGKLTLNKNPTNFFAESESVSFAPSNVVKGISFVPDPLLQWRLMSYDDTANHRHNSPNGYLLPINKAIAPINNNYRDGYMQPQLFEGASTSSPDAIGGVIGASLNSTLPYTGHPPEPLTGAIGRYPNPHDSFTQARTFWSTLDQYAQQHLIDAYRFELSHVTDPTVQHRYIDTILNNIDNCLARLVAHGLGAPLPPLTNHSSPSTTPTFPSLYPLLEPNKSTAGLAIALLADDTHFSPRDLAAITRLLAPHHISCAIVSTRIGTLNTTVVATDSYITTSSVFYDAVMLGGSTGTDAPYDAQAYTFVQEAYGHGKAVGAVGGGDVLGRLGIRGDEAVGVFRGGAEGVVRGILEALAGPVRFPQRFPVEGRGVCG